MRINPNDFTYDPSNDQRKESSTDLPQFLRDMLASPPKHGDGVHLWLFKCARQLHFHREPDDIYSLLAMAAEGCGRHVPEREIRDAIESSKSCAWQPKDSPAPYVSNVATPKWPGVDEVRREHIISEGYGIADLWESSPTTCSPESPDADFFVDHLFPGDPLLCVGTSSQAFETAPRDSFRGRLATLSLVVPSPMSAPTGKRKSDGKESAHTLDNTGPRRFLVTEFDHGSTDEQAAIIHHLSQFAPLVLVVSSGGKSLHAWWRCWDQDETTIKQFFTYAVTLGADPATWTRSQFVRLPGGWRGDKQARQEVYFFNHDTATADTAEWPELPRQSQPEAPELTTGEPPPEPNPLEGIKTTAEILATNIEDDETMLIGHKRRFLGRGGSWVIAGPSGIGKSTLTAGFLLHAAAGKTWHGITFRRPLKILVVQAENDDGDLAEMIEGAIRALEGMTMAQIKLACSNIVWRRMSTMTGEDFTRWLEKTIVATQADLAHIDPLLAYVGDDISSQKVASHFFRNCLQPVLDRTGAMTTMVHHTGKTSTDSKARENWSESDFAYLGFGSSELTNWARAVAVLVPHGKDSGLYKFLIAKRGKRAGMIDANTKQPTTSIILEHSGKGMGWTQAAEPEIQSTAGRKAKLTPADILKHFTPGTATRKDVLVASLAQQFDTSNKTAREKVENMILGGDIKIHETEKRPEGGHPIVWLVAAAKQ